MKIAVIGSPDTFETRALCREGNRHGHEVCPIDYEDLSYSANGLAGADSRNEIFYQNKNLTDFQAVIIRGMTKHIPQALILADYMDFFGKIVIDQRLAKGRYIESKLSSLIRYARAGLPVPRSFQVFQIQEIKKVCQVLDFPLIVKQEMAAKGEGIAKIESFKSLLKFLEGKELSQLFFQEYIPANFDIRVLVVGQKVLGSMKRTAKKGEFRSNIFQGGTGEKFPINSRLKKLAQKATEVAANDIAGVDIMYHQGRPYLLEINRAPQFRGFSKITGINVAEEIIKYAEKRYQKNI